MMRLWADVYGADGGRLGDGPVVSLLSAKISRALDGAGSVRVSAPLSDERARALLTNERRLRVTVEEDGAARELGQGVIKQVRVDDTAGGRTLSADGPDSFEELKAVSVLLARQYLNTTPDVIAAALTSLVPGWSMTAEASANIISARYDGVSVLKALQLLAEQQGRHLRLGTTPRKLEFGVFGQASGLVLINPEMAPAALYANDDVALIERLSVGHSTEAAYNWVIPLGAGEGVAQLTLAKATRGGAYPVQTTAGPDGATLYYLSDQASITTYGLIQKVGVYRNIAPVTNSDGDVVNAANALYDAASADLQRRSVRQDTYRVGLRKARVNVRPGDTVRLLYRGVVYSDGEPFSYLEVDDDFFVLKVSENVSPSGITTELEISTVDRYQQDTVQLVIGALEAIEIRNVFVQPYPTRMGFYSHEAIDSTHSVKVPVTISDATLDLTRALVRLRTTPLRSPVKGTASGGALVGTTASGGAATSSSGGGATTSNGGDHRHKMFDFVSSSNPFLSTRLWYAKNSSGENMNVGLDTGNNDDLYTFDSSGNHTHTVPNHTHTVPAHTHSIDLADHEHVMQYGIFDDTVYPQGIQLWINGVDVTAALGGPWAASSAPVDVELEISTYLLNAAGGLRREHELEWRCASGQGTIRTEVEIVDVIQPIRVT